MRSELDDLTPEEKRLLRSRWARDATGEAAEVAGSAAGCAVNLAVSFGVVVLLVWLALQVIQ